MSTNSPKTSAEIVKDAVPNETTRPAGGTEPPMAPPEALREVLGTYHEAAPLVDPFDNLDALRYRPENERGFNMEKPLVAVPVGKPGPFQFFRVHPDPDYCDQFELIEDEGFYLPSEIKSKGLLRGLLKPKKLFTVVDVSGDPSLWPISFPSPDGRVNRWSHTAMMAAEMAKTKWVRIASNRSIGAYQPYFAEDQLPEPVWPQKTFTELLRIAFEPYLITDPDHPIVKRIRGKL